MINEKIQIDEMAKIIFTFDNKELVKFVNKNLGKKHNPETAKVLRLSSEFNSKNTQGKKTKKSKKNKYTKHFADIIFSIDDCLYNIEFQTTHDGKMLIRIMEYQLHAMLDKLKNITLGDKYTTTITLPHSIVVQLEKSKNVSDHYQITYVDGSTGHTLTQKFPIIKMWEHSIEDLGKNGHHLILPFKPLEHRKKNINVDSFLKDIFEIKEQIFELYNKGVISEELYKEMYEAHYNITIMVAEKYINKQHPKRKEVEDMFTVIKEKPSLFKRYVDGEVAKIIAEKTAESIAQGVDQGVAHGINQGIAQGIAQGEARAIAQKVLKAFKLGWSEKEIIDFFEMSVEHAEQILGRDTVPS